MLGGLARWADAAPEPFRTDAGVLLHPVKLTESDFEGFYEGFSNATLWPLYHDLIVTPPMTAIGGTPIARSTCFADEVAEVAAEGATVWVQDYQLQLLPGILRQKRPDLTIGFFLHIPFPSADLFRQLPWREELVRGLLGADLIGFHLETNARNFLELARRQGLNVEGEASTRKVTAHIRLPQAHHRRGRLPHFYRREGLCRIHWGGEGDIAKLRKELGSPQRIILGVDRLDYTKGILQRLTAFEELLESGALDPEEVALVQLATPSRERLDHYKATRSKVEEAVGRINGRFARVATRWCTTSTGAWPRASCAATTAWPMSCW